MPSKILIVDDEPELRTALRVRLAASGFVCETAGNGREALTLLERWTPDLIVADLLMPEMDGYTFCREIRARQRLAGVPIVVLSAVPRHAIERKEELQADCIMHKPFDSGALLTTIRELLSVET